MVLGKTGMRLEAIKFSIYIGIPVVASIVFNDTGTQKFWADYYQFLKYPANPNIGLKEEFEELQKQRQLQQEQRKEYAEQMKRLQQSAQRSRAQAAEAKDDEQKKKGWLW
jgi:DNA-binding transcriptional MerR regulator